MFTPPVLTFLKIFPERIRLQKIQLIGEQERIQKERELLLKQEKDEERRKKLEGKFFF